MKITFKVEAEVDKENYLKETKILVTNNYRIEAIMELLEKIVTDYKKDKELENE